MTEHITDDQELLADFVLGRLPDTARAEWQDHVAACEPCAEAVRLERALAAGIRRAGRDRLKARIAETGRSVERAIPWPRILSVAAVLAVVVGVGVYEHWFTQENLPVATLDQRPINAQRDVPYQPPADGASKPLPGRDEAGRNQLMEKSARSDERRYAAPPPAAVAGRGGSEIKVNKDVDIGVSPAIAALDDKGGAGAEWIEGNRLDGSPKGDREAPLALQSNGPAAARALGKVSAEGEKKAKEESPAATDALSANAMQFSVQQRPASALPRARQTVSQAIGNTVQTMVVRKGDSLSMTLYLDSLLDERTVQNARVRQVGADSVVVELGGRRIGYRLR
jgi:hypothetical protein